MTVQPAENEYLAGGTALLLACLLALHGIGGGVAAGVQIVVLPAAALGPLAWRLRRTLVTLRVAAALALVTIVAAFGMATLSWRDRLEVAALAVLLQLVPPGRFVYVSLPLAVLWVVAAGATLALDSLPLEVRYLGALTLLGLLSLVGGYFIQELDRDERAAR